jgi:hypothetical protein
VEVVAIAMMKVVLLILLYNAHTGEILKSFYVDDNQLPGFETMEQCEAARTLLKKEEVPITLGLYSKCIIPTIET